MKYSYLLLLLIFVSCQDSKDSKIREIAERLENRKELEEKKVVWVDQEIDIQEKERLKEQRASIKNPIVFVRGWNNDMNKGVRSKIARYYHDPIWFRSQNYHPNGVVGNISGLPIHSPSYHQEITRFVFSLPAPNRKFISYDLEFDVQYSSEKHHAEVTLDALERNGKYSFHRVGDRFMDIMAASKNSVETSIPSGGATYIYDYWVVDLENEKIHPNYTVLEVTSSDVSFRWYDGSTRTMTTYEVRDVSIKDGSISFEAAPNKDQESETNDFEKFRFKALKDEVLLLYNDGEFSKLPSMRMWKAK